MKTNAYQYLFGQESLYQVVEPEPVLRKPAAVTTPAIQPDLVIVEQPVIEIIPEPNPPLPVVEPPVLLAEPEPVPVKTVELVSEPILQPTAAPAPPKPVVEKPKVLLLIDEELTPSELIFLENILKAINLNLNEIDMLNLAGSGLVDFHSVLENKQLHHFISFGVPFKTIHLNIQMDRYEPIRIFGITFLLADTLAAIEVDQKLKRKLWTVLKQVFLD